MSDTLIIGIITGTVALLSVGLNIFWMGKTFDHLSNAINQTREQLSKANDQTRDLIRDLGSRMEKQFDKVDKQFERVDKQFERVDKRFEGIEGDLRQFYKLNTEQAAALQTLRDRNPDLK